MTTVYRPFKSDRPATHADLVAGIATETGFDKKTVTLVMRKLVEVVASHLAVGQGVRLEGLGTFTFRFRKGRVVKWKKHLSGKNPESKTPDWWVVKCRVSRLLQALVRHTVEPHVPSREDEFTIQSPLRAGYGTPNSGTRTGRRPGTSSHSQEQTQETHPQAGGLAVGQGDSGGEPNRKSDSAGTSASGDATAPGSGASGAVQSWPPKPCEGTDAARIYHRLASPPPTTHGSGLA